MRLFSKQFAGTRVLLLLAATIALASCGSSTSDAGATAEAPSETTSVDPATIEAETTQAPTPTEVAPSEDSAAEQTKIVFDNDFGTSVAPILANNCASCHAPGGPGTAHWTLATAQDAVDESISIAASVSVGAMPPWPASHESVSFKNDRSLGDDEIAAILEWANAGAELDVDPTTPITATNQLGLAAVDLSLTPAEPYAGSPANVDDYRCQIYDPGLTESASLLGYDFAPDQSQVVHHAIGYLMPARTMESALERDADDEGAGWECYGGSGLSNEEMLIGWAPGQDASMFPEGTGYVLEPGDFLVIQIHYHYDTDAPADASQLKLMLGDPADLSKEVAVRQYVAPVEIPCMTSQSGPLCDRDAAMARAIERFGTEGVRADGINSICRASPKDFAAMTDGLVSSSCVLPAYGFGEIVSVLGHEHEIGASFRMTLNPGSEDAMVLLDIPVWDFDWQYNYEPTESIVLKPGDTIGIECSWDRSLAADGIEPSYILWADGTNDEMCFSTIVTAEG